MQDTKVTKHLKDEQYYIDLMDKLVALRLIDQLTEEEYKTKRYRCGTYDRRGAKVRGAPLYTIPHSWIETEVYRKNRCVKYNKIL